MDKKKISCLWAVGLALTAVFGSICCLTSAFDLSPVGPWTSLSWILAAVVFAICIPRRLIWYPLGGMVLLFAGLWVHGGLSSSMELLLEQILSGYNMAYGWGFFRWNQELAVEVGTGPALCWLGLPIILATCYAVIRRRETWLAALLAALPLGCCMVVTDRVPGALPLFLLLLTFLLLAMGQMVRARDEAQGNRLLALLAAPVALGLGLLFLLIPQEGYDRQSGAEKLEQWVLSWAQKGFELEEPELPAVTDAPAQPRPTLPPILVTKREDLGALGPKVQSDMKVMSVTAQESQVLYLRGTGYDTYTGVSWNTEGLEGERNWPEASLLTDTGRVEITTVSTQSLMYLPYYVPREVYGDIHNGVVPNSGVRSYAFDSVGVADPVRYALITGDGLETESLSAWLVLPESTREWAAEVIAELFGTESPEKNLATVYKIAEYVRSSAKYSLNTPRMSSKYADFAQWFLMESDRGYCVHFATATAVLLRAAGIPSRYVTGYMVSVEANTVTPVTGKHAHAWAEFCLPGGYWFPLESTPAYAGDVPTPTLPQVTEPSETQPPESSVTEPTGTEPVQTQPVSTESPGDSPTQPPEQEPPVPRRSFPWWPVVLALILAAVVAQWRIRVRLQRSVGRRGRSKRKALERWQQHARMARLLGESPDRQLLELAQKAKFSQHTISSEELAQFTKVIREQEKKLQTQPMHKQLYYTLILALY